MIPGTKKQEMLDFFYSQYCKEKFGGKNRAEMFDKMESKIKEYLKEHKDTRISYQLFDALSEQPLIIAIVTPLMSRIHEMVGF